MFWSITDEELLTAQAGNDESLRRLFGQAVPPCVLIANSLAGRKDVADRVSTELVRRAADQIDRWRDADEASRWFMHQTIQLVRQFRKPLVPEQDVLLIGIGGPDVAEYRAMILALRKLPEQQQEAFILTHAQRWNTRLCAVAMDCSTTAVETHLAEATRQVQPLAGKHFQSLTGFLHQVHKSLPVAMPARPAMIATRMKARRSMRAIVRAFGWLMILSLIGAIVGFALLVWPHIEF